MRGAVGGALCGAVVSPTAGNETPSYFLFSPKHDCDHTRKVRKNTYTK